MKLFVALLATSAAFANADGKSAAARFNRLRRQLSFSEIAGYRPGTQVTDHCAIDLDQQAMEDQLYLQSPESFQKARAIYNDGGHSKSYAKVTIVTGLKADVRKGDRIFGKSAAGTQISGEAAQDYDEGDQELKVYYSTTDIQETYVGCRVGALTEPMLDGCFVEEGDLTIAGEDYAYVYAPETDNRAGRTLAGFSTDAKEKMRTGCKGCPYTDFQNFYDYYGRDDYGHHWVESAFKGSDASFVRGNADFSTYSVNGKEQAIKKGTVHLNVFMYVIRQFEDALDDCELDSLDNNYNSVHAWDEGVCFYAGSLEGVDGMGSGKLLYQLADKRCRNFKTCGEDGTSVEGTSKINHELFDLFAFGNAQMGQGECSAARQTAADITALMYVPMIQGTLRSAYKVAALQGGEVDNAEGATFAAAVLPKVHAISPEAASTIYENMKVGAATTNVGEVKEAFESVYAEMGISCADVGGLWFSGVNDYYEGMEPCVDTPPSVSPTSSPVSPTPPLVSPTPPSVSPTLSPVSSAPTSTPTSTLLDESSAGYQLELITSFYISMLLYLVF